MPKKSTNPPSEFWLRLVECWGDENLPTSQNGVAKRLFSAQSDTGKMSQGSVSKWYNGEGLPDRDKLVEVARKGRVTIDWLLLARFPKRSVEPGSLLEQLLTIWDDLPQDAREHVFKVAEYAAEALNHKQEKNSRDTLPTEKRQPATLRKKRTG